MGGNKLFNKIARVSSARLLSANGELDEALKVLEKYSSSSTNAYIHELTGDIFLKKGRKFSCKRAIYFSKR